MRSTTNRTMNSVLGFDRDRDVVRGARGKSPAHLCAFQSRHAYQASFRWREAIRPARATADRAISGSAIAHWARSLLLALLAQVQAMCGPSGRRSPVEPVGGLAVVTG